MRKKRRRPKRNTLDNRLLRKYGVTLEMMQALLIVQGGLCRMCHEPFTTQRPPVVDHCHGSGKIRGLLHRRCNMLVGMVENGERLRLCQEYLATHGVKQAMKYHSLVFAFRGDNRVILFPRRVEGTDVSILDVIRAEAAPDEVPIDTAHRAFKEAIGVSLEPERLVHFCQMRSSVMIVDCYRVLGPVLEAADGAVLSPFDQLPAMNLMPNLRWLVPMARYNETHAVVRYR